MFSGIVEGIGSLRERVPERNCFLIEVPPALTDGIKVGDSLSVSGVCLTVSEIKDGYLGFNLSPETLSRTYFSTLKIGDKLNLERSLKIGDRLHGHWVTGHIDEVGVVVSIEDFKDFKAFVFEFSRELFKNVVPKGPIAIDGVSLTVNRCHDRTIEVMLIPQTLQTTIFGEKKEGDRVQVELDLIGKYVHATH